MAATNVTPTAPRSYPRPWETIVDTLGLLIIVIAALLLYVGNLEEHTFDGVDGMLLLTVAGAVLLPLMAVAVVLGRRARAAEEAARVAAKQREQSRRNEQQALDQKKQREFTLEVLAMGALFDHFQHEALWQALQQGDPYTSIRNNDPKTYPWSAAQKLEASATKADAAFVQAIQVTPKYWVAPLLHATPGTQPNAGNGPTYVPTESTVQHPFAIPDQQPLAPERIIEQAFALFDTYPELPYVVVFADNSLTRREHAREHDTASLATDGYCLPVIADTVAVLVLGRRDRVAALRAHAWNDPKGDYMRVTTTRAYQASVTRRDEGQGGAPTITDWLACADRLAGQPLRYDGIGPAHIKAWEYDPPRSWKPTPWLPVAWAQTQLASFDHLPVLALVHRPVHIAFTDAQDQTSTTRNDRRLAMLMAGWQQALQALPGEVREAGPARVFAATGNNQRQLLALHGLLHQYAAQGGPEIDTSDIAVYVEMERRLGEAGVAMLPLQIALGVQAASNQGGLSAIIYCRADGAGATIVFVRPKEEE